jgi:hypothetical protein
MPSHTARSRQHAAALAALRKASRAETDKFVAQAARSVERRRAANYARVEKEQAAQAKKVRAGPE